MALTPRLINLNNVIPTSPTQTIIASSAFTNGTTVLSAQTYVPPANCKWVRVRMVGGGGGGGGSATTGLGGNGGNGGNTTFGTSLLSAGGGVGGNGAGVGPPTLLGVANAGSASGIAIQGASGATPPANSFTYTPGGNGGSAPFFSGAGGGSIYGTGAPAITNTGGGGQGGGSNGTAATIGTGGQSGGFVEVILTSLLSSYSFAVGSAGSAGVAGAGAGAASGGTAGSGFIAIEEHYDF